MLTHHGLILAARTAVGLSQKQVAKRAQVGTSTVSRLELGQSVAIRSFAACQKVLEDEGVLFFQEGNRVGFTLPIEALRALSGDLAPGE